MTARGAEFEVVGPVFVFAADGELLSFETAGSAGSYLEAIDVRNGEYGVAFDASGCPLRLTIYEERLWPRWFGAIEHVEVALDPDPSPRPHELEELLRAYLNGRTGECADGLELSELVSRAHARARCG